MTRDDGAWRRILRLVRKDPREDVDDELRFHLDMRRTDLERSGLTPDEARAAAERKFGDVAEVRDACEEIDRRQRRRAARAHALFGISTDFVVALRGLRGSPVFTTTAVLCAALGIGLTTAIASTINSILLRPLPYADADRLVAVYSANPHLGMDAHYVNISYPDYLSWRDENRTLSQLGMWTWTSVTLSGAGEAERIDGAEMSTNMFEVLGVKPALGRGFQPGEDRKDRNHVVVLSDALWRRRFGADPRIIGRVITLEGESSEIVGVMPPGFMFPETGELWVPLSDDPIRASRGNRYFAGAIGRMRAGVTLDQATGDLQAVASELSREFPKDNTGWTIDVRTLREDLVGNLRAPLLLFMVAVAFVLAIVCANVANLMLARGAARQRELAVRAAIGAGVGRLVRQVLVESAVLAITGGVLGAAVAAAGIKLFALAFPDGTPFYISLRLDGATLAFAGALALLTGLVFGCAPAVAAARTAPQGVLRETSAGAGEARHRSRARRTLTVVEIALSTVLLTIALLLVRSYHSLTSTDLGFQGRGVLTMRVSLPENVYTDRSRRAQFFADLLSRVQAMPGVLVAGSALGTPMSGMDLQDGVVAEGQPLPAPNEEVVTHSQQVSPRYFEALGIPLLRGRVLTPQDRGSAAAVGVVNDIFVAKVFSGQDPIGKRVKLGPVDDTTAPWITIVGVTRAFRHYRLPQPMGPAIYLPIAFHAQGMQTLAIRTSLADPLSLVPAIQRAVHDLDPNVPVYRIETLDHTVSRTLWRQRLQGQVVGAFAVVALVLAAIGLYGVIAYSVAQRTREIGVRMALGAQRRDVLSLVLGDGARMTAIGLAIGLAGAAVLAKSIASLLYGVQPLDMIVFVGSAVVLAAVALAASVIPARRAARVDPQVAMRTV